MRSPSFLYYLLELWCDSDPQSSKSWHQPPGLVEDMGLVLLWTWVCQVQRNGIAGQGKVSCSRHFWFPLWACHGVSSNIARTFTSPSRHVKAHCCIVSTFTGGSRHRAVSVVTDIPTKTTRTAVYLQDLPMSHLSFRASNTTEIRLAPRFGHGRLGFSTEGNTLTHGAAAARISCRFAFVNINKIIMNIPVLVIMTPTHVVSGDLRISSNR